MFTIYKVMNKITKDFYIGFTASLNPENRFQRHRKNSRIGVASRLYSAMRKYGIENFVFSILEVGENIEYGHKIAEPSYIRWLNPKYNMTIGGDGVVGYIYTKEARENISTSLCGRKLSKQHRIIISERMRGKIVNLDVKKKISNTLSGRKLSITHVKRMSESLRGRTLTNAHKKAIAESQKKRWTHRLDSKSPDFQSGELGAVPSGSTMKNKLSG